MKREDRVILLIVAIAAAALVLFILMSTKAYAHDWYESSCCSEQDCHPVDDGVVTERSGGLLDIKGHGVMSINDPRIRWSQDQRDHLCEAPQYNGGKKLLCVYRKMSVF